MAYTWGSKISDRIDRVVRQKPTINMSALGETLGSPGSVSREAKGKRYAKFLKDLARVLDQLSKVADLLGIQVLELLFPKISPEERSMETRLMARLDMIESSLQTVLSEIKKTGK